MKVACFCFLLVLACSGAVPTPDECAPLIHPQSLDDHSKLIGTKKFIRGFADHAAYEAILKVTDSTRITISDDKDHDKNLGFYEEMLLNGTCYGTRINMSIDDHVINAKMLNFSSTIELLPTCDGCLVLNINSSAHDLKNFMEEYGFHLDNISNDEIHVHALYLFAADENTVKDADLEHFKKQAECLHFSGEPVFKFDPKKEFCDGHKVVMFN
ncbi:uncharacterized protein LOC130911022 [Corythoichthys intestinalis]|uniref:uncharacterized protein LOC130911022 n=1 Tax=Corythoichthys intestinalis TaxID=161448 RepID=UPI0025A55047|nr:uncharacterized protein LOC130911022 [Corythoichthys intestinalis]